MRYLIGGVVVAATVLTGLYYPLSHRTASISANTRVRSELEAVALAIKTGLTDGALEKRELLDTTHVTADLIGRLARGGLYSPSGKYLKLIEERLCNSWGRPIELHVDDGQSNFRFSLVSRGVVPVDEASGDVVVTTELR